MSLPDPDRVYPMSGNDRMINVKPTIQNPNILVGDFTYFADRDFESHVTHHYDFIGDRLIIGRYCQIAAGVEFVMNGANHRMNAATTFPFYIFDGWEQAAPPLSELPIKGDTVVGSDVWIGQNAVILPGVHIGDGAVVGANSVVGSDVAPYTIVAGNPARPVRRRFDDELIDLLLKLRWWDRDVGTVKSLLPLLTTSDTEQLRRGIKERIA